MISKQKQKNHLHNLFQKMKIQKIFQDKIINNNQKMKYKLNIKSTDPNHNALIYIVILKMINSHNKLQKNTKRKNQKLNKKSSKMIPNFKKELIIRNLSEL